MVSGPDSVDVVSVMVSATEGRNNPIWAVARMSTKPERRSTLDLPFTPRRLGRSPAGGPHRRNLAGLRRVRPSRFRPQSQFVRLSPQQKLQLISAYLVDIGEMPLECASTDFQLIRQPGYLLLEFSQVFPGKRQSGAYWRHQQHGRKSICTLLDGGRCPRRAAVCK